MQLRSFNTPVADPGLAAALLALGFPLTAPPELSESHSLDSRPKGTRAPSQVWYFGAHSLENSLTREQFFTAWGTAPPNEAAEHPVQRCRRCLRNLRVLQTFVHKNGQLYSVRRPWGVMLTSWPEHGASPIEEGSEIPPGTPMTSSTSLAAAAVTLGLPCLGFRWDGGLARFYFGAASDSNLSLGELEARKADLPYLRKTVSPMSQVLALLFNRKQLKLQTREKTLKKNLILQKGDRYAVLSSAADEQLRERAFRHLCL